MQYSIIILEVGLFFQSSFMLGSTQAVLTGLEMILGVQILISNMKEAIA